AGEYQIARSCQHWSPRRGSWKSVCPYFLSCVDVPCLDFTEVRSTGYDSRLHVRDVSASRRIRVLLTGNGGTEVVVRGDIDHPSFGAEGDGRPVLTAGEARTVVRGLSRARFVFGIDVRTTGLRVETPVDVLFHIRRAFDKSDLVVAAFK